MFVAIQYHLQKETFEIYHITLILGFQHSLSKMSVVIQYELQKETFEIGHTMLILGFLSAFM